MNKSTKKFIWITITATQKQDRTIPVQADTTDAQAIAAWLEANKNKPFVPGCVEHKLTATIKA